MENGEINKVADFIRMIQKITGRNINSLECEIPASVLGAGEGRLKLTFYDMYFTSPSPASLSPQKQETPPCEGESPPCT